MTKLLPEFLFALNKVASAQQNFIPEEHCHWFYIQTAEMKAGVRVVIVNDFSLSFSTPCLLIGRDDGVGVFNSGGTN